MKKFRFLSLAVAAVLCAGSACDDGPDKPKNTITENTNGGSGNGGDTGNGGNDNGGSDNGGGGNSYTPANPETDEYGIAVSQEVDLGLSVNWAGWNIGATSPDEYGGCYAWGETVEKNYYEWSTYKWCRGSYDTMTKYCTDSYYGTVDNKTVLEPQDDVAYKKWGNGWRMPTKEELEELKNTNNCTWEWITYKGGKGYKVTGRRLSNGKRNSIFLPAAGYYRDGTSLYNAGSGGYYWSSTLRSFYSYGAYELTFFSDSHFVYNNARYLGQSVRPVKEK